MCSALLYMYYFVFICFFVTQVENLYFYTALAGVVPGPPLDVLVCRAHV